MLGAKHVKAIVVRGSQRCAWAHPQALAERARDLSARSFGPATAKYRELGTVANLVLFNRLQALPTRNFQQGSFDGAEGLSPEGLAAARDKTRASCAACTIGCEHIYQIRSGEAEGKGVRMEYENLFALGPLCDIRDVDTVLTASRRCDELGIDTISAGGTIALAMECVERGWLDAPWLRFGDPVALLRALDEIGQRGTRRSAGGREQAARARARPRRARHRPASQGTGDPRLRTARAADHGARVGREQSRRRSQPIGAYEADFSDRVDRRRLTPASAALAIETEDKAALIDSLILCKFLRGVFPDLVAEAAEMLRLVTGWDITSEELRNGASHPGRQEVVQHPRGLATGRRHAPRTLPRRRLVG